MMSNDVTWHNLIQCGRVFRVDSRSQSTVRSSRRKIGEKMETSEKLRGSGEGGFRGIRKKKKECSSFFRPRRWNGSAASFFRIRRLQMGILRSAEPEERRTPHIRRILPPIFEEPARHPPSSSVRSSDRSSGPKIKTRGSSCFGAEDRRLKMQDVIRYSASNTYRRWQEVLLS